MSSFKFKHQKKRSTGIVYEMLIRRLTKTLIDHDKDSYQKTLGIIRKYFTEGSLLMQEKELFDVVNTTRGVTESAARKILAEVQRTAAKLDKHKLDIKKSNLIKDINYSFGKDFFVEHRIPDYRILATIQLLINKAGTESCLTESMQKIQLEESIVAYMSSPPSETVTAFNNKPEIDRLVMAMVAKRFNEKYSNSLVPSQKKLLERYIRYQVTGDCDVLRTFFIDEAKRVVGSMDKSLLSEDIVSDSIMVEKMKDARNQLVEIADNVSSSNAINDEYVEQLMLYQKLVEEVESDG